MALTKPILFLCHHMGFCIVIYLEDILVLLCSKWAGKRACLFLCSLLVCLGLHINFSRSDLCLTQPFCFLGLCWDTVHMSVSLPPDKLADIQWLALSLLWTQNVTVYTVMSFLGKTIFCTNGHSQQQHLCHVIQSDMLHVYHSATHLFLHAHFCPFLLMSTGMVGSFAFRAQFLCNFHFLMWLLLLIPCPLTGPFIFRDLGYLYWLVVLGWVLCVGHILPCRSSRPLP